MGNLKRQELMESAEAAIRAAGGPDRAEVYFKFTCANCGARMTLSTPNVLFESGECCDCGCTTPIMEGGYLLRLKI